MKYTDFRKMPAHRFRRIFCFSNSVWKSFAEQARYIRFPSTSILHRLKAMSSSSDMNCRASTSKKMFRTPVDCARVR